MPRHGVIPPAPRGGPRPGQTYTQSIIEVMDQRKVQIDPDDPKSLRSIFFNPDLETSARIIQALLSPNNSLAGIARDHATTLEALSTWMARPDIAQRIHHMKRAAAVQHSLTATFQLAHAVKALVIILQEYCDAACHEAGLKAGRGSSPDEHNRRDRETARKACQLLARLAHFDQTIRPPRSPRENILTPDHIPSIFPTSNGDTARGFAEMPQNPGGHAGAPDAPPPPAHPLPEEDPQALLTQITDLLAHLRNNPLTPSTPPAASEPAAAPSSDNPPPPASAPPSETSDLKLEIAPAPPTTPTTQERSNPLPQPSAGSPDFSESPPSPPLRPFPPNFLAKVKACNCGRGIPCKGCPPDVINARFEPENAALRARARDPTSP
ncbi:MAG TPA: hypothetical protein VHC70_04760 [Phycisphaerales bacterium]|nr:hypothetical protein [Phycisphaerales bacterium]